MRRSGLASVLLIVSAACAKPAEAPPVRGAWVRLPAVPGNPGALYFTLAGQPSPDRLERISSADIQRIELHHGGMRGGMMTMAPMSGADVGPEGKAFAPGGDHAMLFGLSPAARPGRTLSLRFHFERRGDVAVEAAIVAAGDPPPAR